MQRWWCVICEWGQKKIAKEAHYSAICAWMFCFIGHALWISESLLTRTFVSTWLLLSRWTNGRLQLIIKSPNSCVKSSFDLTKRVLFIMRDVSIYMSIVCFSIHAFWLSRQKHKINTQFGIFLYTSLFPLLPLYLYCLIVSIGATSFRHQDPGADASAATQCPVAMLPFKIPSKAFQVIGGGGRPLTDPQDAGWPRETMKLSKWRDTPKA